ncbi:hypothetical protein [Actinoplanes couchii]|uniref:hypothetical protein n=1 Tax=Actinoplanes couchii TaxID=403638 RepID=UPI001940967B|nr:hypothetical protein [Actinoplanes couchii]
MDHDPPDSGRDSAETADDSDENGRDDMNGRAGAPGYAQTGEAGPDGTGDAATEPQGPAEPVRSAAGWASVPSQAQPVTPTSGGPVSGVPVSPAYANPYSVADFTPDHPAANLQSAEPVPAAPVPAPAAGSASVPVSAVSPMSPAAPVSPVYLASPVSPASPVHPASPATPAPLAEPEEKAEEKEEKPVPAIHASVQIPLTRPPADEPVEQPAPDSGYGYTPAGYSLGRTPEVYGVASVTPAPVSAPPQPPLFPAAQEFPAVAAKEFAPIVETSLTIDVPARRSADPEDADQPRRAVAARRVVPAEESVPVEGAPSDEPLIARTVWDEDAARHFRAAWHEVKAEFVDDPVTALTRAHDLLTDAVNELTEVLLAERDELDPLRGTDTPDTESMRMAMRGYREYLERILSL